MILSFKVIREGHAFVTSWNGFSDPKNIGNKKKSIVLGQAQPKLVKVTYSITWPWVSRSFVKVTHLWLVGMDSLTQKNIGNKKNSIVFEQAQPKLVKVTYNIAWHDGAVVCASGWRSGGPRFKSGPRLISQSWSSYQLNQLGSKAASDSTLKQLTLAGYQILVLFFTTSRDLEFQGHSWKSRICD